MRLAIAFVVLFVGPASSFAASISLSEDASAYSLFLNGDADNGAFNTVDVSLKTLSGGVFSNLDSNRLDGFIPRVPGDPYTFVNALLAYDQGEGWTILVAHRIFNHYLCRNANPAED